MEERMEPAAATGTRKPITRRTEKRLKAMTHPLRRSILRAIIEWGRPVSPKEVADGLRTDLKSVSYHCRELVKYGCIEKVRTEQVRGAVKSFYVATDRHLIDDEEWNDLPHELREGALADFMEPIVSDFTRAAKDGILGEDSLWHITRTPIHALDAQGLEDLLAAHRELYDRVGDIHAESLERLRASEEEPIMVSSNQACFKVRNF
jgi:DNA-binding MarR family transcriptional regulator